ncbi:alpha/beta hydrolase [Microbacterium sp. LWH3-1.2]|uniref:alpha/beta hydrolase n=1 Tax=Microbacterium sp. LWH3-1.2 TaxID=3135256 RepID=UPI003433F604
MTNDAAPVMVEWFGAGGWTPIPDLVDVLEKDPAAYDARPGARPAEDKALLAKAGVTVTDLTIPGDVPVQARLYRPAEPHVSAAVVWVHGGGFIFYSLDGPEAHHISSVLAAGGIAVLSLDYRKAIGGVHYPAPSDDILTGWLWATQNLDRLGIEQVEELHLAGASAGGNLAAGVAKRLRDGAGPLPASVALAYPFIGPNAQPVENPPTEAFPDWWLEQMAQNYVGDTALLTDPYAFPLNGTVAGLPPTFLVLSDIDTIRPSGEAYAAALESAGVETHVHVEPGTTHGQLDRPGTRGAEETIAAIQDWLLREN